MHKEFRVDCFFYDDNTGKVSEHTINKFDDIQNAVDFASEERKKNAVTWMLKHVFDGQYEPWFKLI